MNLLVQEIGSITQEAFRVLKPGGVFTIKTPNKSYLHLTNIMHRIQALMTLRNPLNIHIAHTKNNPDNEHHGLISHKNLLAIFDKTMFHSPTVTKAILTKESLPNWVSKFLMKFNVFNPTIIITARKPIFYGIYG